MFEECVVPLVDGLFHRYNATVLAYGQTRSGETYTMGTGYRDGYQKGIIPQVMDAIFNKIETQRHEAEFQLHVSFIELHTEMRGTEEELKKKRGRREEKIEPRKESSINWLPPHDHPTGAEVRWCSCNIFSTQDHAVAAIARDNHLLHPGSTERALDWGPAGGPDLIVDEGGDATLLIHEGVKAEEFEKSV